MRLTRVRLHPFGRFHDESRDLGDPVVVIDGANEAGKSTLRQAVFHAFFTPTNLTPARLRDTMARWFPEPGGDHAAVTLTFEHDGETWTLFKRWGAANAATLSGSGGPIADPKVVQERLEGMLRHGEATFRHVLFTGQAELERTLEAIAANAADLKDVADLLKAGADAAGDVDEHTLRRVLGDRINGLFGRWDEERGRPERQNGQEKGIDNKWVRGCGEILKAWYAWQEIAAEHGQIVGLEKEVDRINALLAEIEAEAGRDEAMLKTGVPLRTALSERETLEERVQRLTSSVGAMTAAFSGWQPADVAITNWQEQKPKLEEQHGRLKAELSDALERRDAVSLIAAHERLMKARVTWQEADGIARSCSHPDAATLAEIDRLDAAVTAADNKLAARSLAWRIEASERGVATVERGADPAETIDLTGGRAEGTAAARVRVRVAGVTLTVDSGGDDVTALFEARASDSKSLEAVLTACGAVSVAAARGSAEAHKTYSHEAHAKKAAYESQLAGKTFEQWQEAVARANRLPQTRAVEAINEEISGNRTSVGNGDTACEGHMAKLAKWRAEYGVFETLAERLFTEKRELEAVQAKLDAMPTVPSGFASVKDFLAALDKAQDRLNESRKRQSELVGESGQLEGAIGDRRSEDLAERVEMAERAFRRIRGQGRDYRHIQAVLDRVAAGDGDDPLAGFSARVGEIFSRVTGAAANLGFNGSLPASVTRGAVSLSPDRLSQGGNGALALAVRLAMAEAYIADGDGFIMLDDPFVHFDAGRMGEAAAILRECSGRFQVLFFTCHEHHAAEVRSSMPPSLASDAE